MYEYSFRQAFDFWGIQKLSSLCDRLGQCFTTKKKHEQNMLLTPGSKLKMHSFLFSTYFYFKWHLDKKEKEIVYYFNKQFKS